MFYFILLLVKSLKIFILSQTFKLDIFIFIVILLIKRSLSHGKTCHLRFKFNHKDNFYLIKLLEFDLIIFIDIKSREMLL